MASHQALVIEFAVPEGTFGSAEHIETLNEAHEKFMSAVEPLVNPRKLAQWIRPLHPFQTGMVSSRASSVRADVENLKGVFSRFVADPNSDANMKSALRECHKSLLTNLNYVYGGIEVAFPEYLASQIDNTSLSVQGCMERALQNDISQYEIAYRLCITESIKLARIANTKGFQTSNVDVQKELGDAAFTSLRASSVLTNLGRSYMVEHSDQAVQNMAQIAKALVGQYQKIGDLSKIEITQTDSIFTPETIAAFHQAYDSACKLLEDSVAQYSSTTEADQTILTICAQLVEQVPPFKETLTNPNTRLFATSVTNISRLIQLLVIHVSSLLQPDTDAPIYHMCLNGMFAALHYSVQLNVSATCKALYHPIIPPELSALCSIRLMFGTLAVVLVNAITSLSSASSSPSEDNYEGLDMITASIVVPNSSITDVLHYGRPLIIREDPKVHFIAGGGANNEPETVNSILNALEEDLGLEKGSDPMTPSKQPDPVAKPTSSSTTISIATSSNPLGAPPVIATSSPKRTRPSIAEFSRGAEPSIHVVSAATKPKPAAEPVVVVAPQKEIPKPAPEPAVVATSSNAGGAGAASSSSGAGTGDSAGGGPPGAPTPWTTIPADSIDENNLPPGYPPVPPKVGAFEKGGGEDAYKKWMVDRYNREAAENALIVYKRKLKAAQQSVGIN
jgi:hypothetical protein